MLRFLCGGSRPSAAGAELGRCRGGRVAAIAALLAGASALASPYFTIEGVSGWMDALMTGRVQPVLPHVWDDYMVQWQLFHEEGEPYPLNEFRPPLLDVWGGGGGGGGGAWPMEPGLIMAWGDELMPPGDYSSAWMYDYQLDPNLNNVTIKITVIPPRFGPAGQINFVSFGLRDVAGAIRSWSWRCGPGQPLPWFTATTIYINTTFVGLNAAQPVATGYANNPLFNLAAVQWLIVDENAAWVGGPNPVPPPGMINPIPWNYWRDLSVTPTQIRPPVPCCLPNGQCVPLDHNTCVFSGGDPYGPADNCATITCQPFKWVQPPLYDPLSPQPCFWGWDEQSRFDGAQIVADDFLCVEQTPITDVHWWGSYENWTGAAPPPIAPQAFHIGIWMDVPSNPDDPMSFSHPGVLFREWVVARGRLNERPVACDFFPPLMPGGPDGCFRYDFRIPREDWFLQDAANTVFWISISAVYPPVADVPNPWGWKTRPHFWNDDAVRIFAPTNPALGAPYIVGAPILDPFFVSWDMAFVLTTGEIGPVAEACCLPDGGCVDLDAYECIAQRGGVPQGPGTSCAGLPAPCPHPKWSQPPTAPPDGGAHRFYGWNELSLYHGPQFAADDWYCLDDRTITDVHWWGSYEGWEQETPPVAGPIAFHVGIWTDVPANPDGDPPWSHPGTLIWSRFVRREVLRERPVGIDVYPDRLPETCFQYDWAMAPADVFRQDPSANRVHWLSIAAVYRCACNGDFDNDGDVDADDVAFFIQCFANPGADPRCWRADLNCDGLVNAADLAILDCQLSVGWPDPGCCDFAEPPPPHPWGWKTRRPHWNDDAIRMFAPIPPWVGALYGFGQPIEGPEGSWDLAFVLTTPNPELPQACCYRSPLGASCVDVLPSDCLRNYGGIPQGLGSTCATVVPAITAGPASQFKCVGQSATFSVTATGAGPLAYQWRKDGVDIVDEKNSTYTIASVTLADAGGYDCVVSNGCGTAISATAALTVGYAPTITQHPLSLTRCVGETATFSVVADGSPAPSYQWRFEGADIGGATGSSYTINAVSTGDAGDYDCVVTNVCGSATSHAATLTVDVPPAIGTQPLDVLLCQRDSATFTVVATGAPAPTYQWYHDNVLIPGATGASYTIASAAGSDAGGYKVLVRNHCGQLFSRTALLVVYLKGDSNVDRLVNFDDIDCFVAALISQAAWNACGHGLGSSYICANDIDGNGLVNFDDIDPFVVCLIAGECP